MLYLILLKFIIFLLFCVWLNKRSRHFAMEAQARGGNALRAKQNVDATNDIESIKQSRALTMSY